VYNYARIPLRKQILKETDAITVEYGPIKKHVQKYTDIPAYTMTPVIAENQSVITDYNKPIQVTIPGNIVESRRQYNLVFDALNRLTPEMQSQLSLNLLGRPIDSSSKRILAKADELINEGLDITYHEDWIPGDEFDDTLADSDILLSPLCREIPYGVSIEKYGQSKSSGVLADAIRTATPLILPTWFQIPNELKDCTLTFRDSDDLAGIFETILVNKQQLKSLKYDAERATDNYRIGVQAKHFHNVITTTCDTVI
jgi:hypothetical protein